MSDELDLSALADQLRGLLSAVASGYLEARTPQAIAILRRLEGAAVTIEALAGSRHLGPRIIWAPYGAVEE